MLSNNSEQEKKNEELGLLRYDFVSWGDENNTFVFETDHEVEYEIKFKPSFYLFANYPSLSAQVYECVIDIAFKPDKKIPTDSKIALTVASIFETFFLKIEKVVVYICATSDRKHLARQRKFIQWFDQLNQDLFCQIENRIPDKDGIIYINTLILRKDNPQFAEITDAFDDLTAGYEEK